MDNHCLDALAERLHRARQWAWGVFDYRVPGAARDLSWSLIALARDYDPETYSRWPRAHALEPEHMVQALDLATDIAGLIRKADKLQPNLIRSGGVGHE